MKTKPHIVIVSHVVFVDDNEVYGPGHSVSKYLLIKKINHTFIKHSLYGGNRSRIEKKTAKQNRGRESRLPRKAIFRYFQYFWELLTTLNYLFSHKKVDVLIAIDPLNAFAGIVGRIFGRVDTLIFYTADYAFKRFNNGILNSIYHGLDYLARTYSDYTWNVSSRITEVRADQGLPAEKNKLVPNSPILQTMTIPVSKRKPYSMVLIANFTPAIRYDLIVEAVQVLKKKYPKIFVSFVGSGEREDNIKELVSKKKLEKHFAFHGYQQHDKAVKILSQHQIGLALYDNKWSWTEFGDSLKAREYLALGLPVIINDHISTADDIDQNDAGYSIKLTKKKLLECLNDAFESPQRLKEMQKNAKKVARKYDLEKILDRELLTLLQN